MNASTCSRRGVAHVSKQTLWGVLRASSRWGQLTTSVPRGPDRRPPAERVPVHPTLGDSPTAYLGPPDPHTMATSCERAPT